LSKALRAPVAVEERNSLMLLAMAAASLNMCVSHCLAED
jgi:hypothetical protein